MVIFTDACLEDGDSTAGIGMVALRCSGGRVLSRCFFSEKVPASVLSQLQDLTPKVIAALELLAAVKAGESLQNVITATRVFLFVDNEATRANLISMSSPVVTHAELLKKLWKVTRLKSAHMWISRVPSAANIADKPSRFLVSDLLQAGFTRMYPRMP